MLKRGQSRRPHQNYQRIENSLLTPEHPCTSWGKRIRARPSWILCGDPGTPQRLWQPMEAQAFVHDLELFVTVQLLEDTLAVLSRGKLCEENGYSDEWQNCQKPQLTKNGKEFFWKTENVVPLVLRELSSSSGTSSSCTSPAHNSSSISSSPATPQSDMQATGDRLRGSQSIQRTLKVSACTRFSGLGFGTNYESGRKIKGAQYWYSLHKRPKLRSMLANQDDKGSLQKTHWWCSTGAEKVWWLDNSAIDFTNVPRAVWKAESRLHWQFVGNLEKTLLKIYHRITELEHFIDLRRTLQLQEHAEWKKEHQQHFAIGL